MPAALLADALLPARNQMALSLGWHIVLACYGMAFPAMIFVVHRRGLAGDTAALELAKRWSKVAAVLFAIGAVSGTILSFEMGLLWPGLMARYGDVFGLAFALEGVAFFLEAIFLGIYVYGWDRLPPRWHLAMLAPIFVSGVAGSFMVLAVNAWMNAPAGFRLTADGQVTDVDPVAAIFNSAVGYEFAHMYLAGVMVVGFGTAAVYALGWRRGRHDRLHRLGVLVPLTFAAVAAPIQPLVGHFAGQRVADDQPVKLAAAEALAETTESAPFTLGGWWNGERLVGGIEVPIDGLLSLIAQNDPDATVLGLDSVPPDERPPVGIVHIAFDTMVGLGTLMALLGLWTIARWLRARGDRGDVLATDRVSTTWFLRALVVAGPAAVVAMEAGWVVTEVGRQPWIVHGLMRTSEAVTDAGYIWFTLGVLVVVYTAMTVAAVVLLRSMSRRWRAGLKDLPSPYGPAAFEPVDALDPESVAARAGAGP